MSNKLQETIAQLSQMVVDNAQRALQDSATVTDLADQVADMEQRVTESENHAVETSQKLVEAVANLHSDYRNYQTEVEDRVKKLTDIVVELEQMIRGAAASGKLAELTQGAQAHVNLRPKAAWVNSSFGNAVVRDMARHDPQKRSEDELRRELVQHMMDSDADEKDSWGLAGDAF